MAIFKSKQERDQLSTLYFKELRALSSQIEEAIHNQEDERLVKLIKKARSLSKLFGNQESAEALTKILNSQEKGEEVSGMIRGFFAERPQEKIQELFVESMREEGEKLLSGLMDLELGKKEASIDDLLRTLHSMKGNLALMGFHLAKRLVHAIEELLKQRRKLESEEYELLFHAVDLLKEEESIEMERVIQQLQKRPSVPQPATTAQVAPEQQKTHFAHVDEALVDRLIDLITKSRRTSQSIGEYRELFEEELSELTKALSELDCLKESLMSAGGNEEACQLLDQAIRRLQKIECEQSRQESAFFEECEKEEILSEELYSQAFEIRLRPFGEMRVGLQRLVRDLAHKLDKEVDFQIEGEEVQVDREVLEKIRSPLIHILRNAVAHGIEQPEEREKLGKSRRGLIKLQVKVEGHLLVIEIHDDGKGIDFDRIRKNISDQRKNVPFDEKELLDFLFLPEFSTAEKVTEYSGRGMGLNVVLKECEALRGEVSMDSTPNLGTSFKLHLPVVGERLPEPQDFTPGNLHSLPTTQKRILVVDGSVAIREMMQKELEEQGCHVETAFDGIEALVKMRFSHFDLLISDLEMPRMSGEDLIRFVKKNPLTASVTCMLMSSSEEKLEGVDQPSVDIVIHKNQVIERVRSENG